MSGRGARTSSRNVWKTPTDKATVFGGSWPVPYGRGSDWIDATDRRIDQLVNELYGLSDEEIRIVEEATTRPITPGEEPKGRDRGGINVFT